MVRGHRLSTLCADRADAGRCTCAACALGTAPCSGLVAGAGAVGDCCLAMGFQPHRGVGHVGAVLFWCLRPGHVGLLGGAGAAGAGMGLPHGAAGGGSAGGGFPGTHCRGCGHGLVLGGGHALCAHAQLFWCVAARKARPDVVLGVSGALCRVLACERGGQPPLACITSAERRGHAPGVWAVAGRWASVVSASGASCAIVVHGPALATGAGGGWHAGGHYQQLGVAPRLGPQGQADWAVFLSALYPSAQCSVIAKACVPAVCVACPETTP